jgi:hypothetical protein
MQENSNIQCETCREFYVLVPRHWIGRISSKFSLFLVSAGIVGVLMMVSCLILEFLLHEENQVSLYNRIVQGISIFAMMGFSPVPAFMLVPNVYFPSLILQIFTKKAEIQTEFALFRGVSLAMSGFCLVWFVYGTIKAAQYVHSKVVCLHKMSKSIDECDAVDLVNTK